ncbi:M10 family metallopeptidase C-terminal domain-containing protein [Neptunicoccus cionae]|uniref:M10 family metallopeptidase C-terminal domain-containing protein n=1 Tax=Neptunicoccus cionae TaxID=2035344 RepID=UPI000C779D19|nr:M12 family metallo-peptidase [Amylibacter cionae]PLS21644.1 type I secretion protein [Amylibacter cionae]
MTVVSDYTALLQIEDSTSARWNATEELGTPVIVTYSFAEGDEIPSVRDSAYPVTRTFAFTELQRQNFRDAADVYERAAGVVFVEVDSGGMIDISNADGSAYGGWASYPSTSARYTSNGIFVIDSEGDYREGTYGFQIMLHELGHAMGLKHTHDGSLILDPALDNQTQTVMTYNNASPYTSQLGVLDLEALEHLYGSAVESSAWMFDHDAASNTMTIAGSSKADVLFGVGGSNVLIGGAKGDRLIGRNVEDTLFGNQGNDTLSGGDGADTLSGNGGKDALYGGYHSDSVNGGRGADQLYGGAGLDVLEGAQGGDTLYGEDYNDSLFGGRGADILFGGDDQDTLYGEAGKDRLYGGGSGGDVLYGGNGKDWLYSGAEEGGGGSYARDYYGGNGNDRMFGGDGYDYFYGGAGKDTMTGGAGYDVFHFSEDAAKDRIKDFEDGIDRISLTEVSFDFSDLKFVSKADGASTLIKVNGYSASIFLNDVAADTLDAWDFVA